MAVRWFARLVRSFVRADEQNTEDGQQSAKHLREVELFPKEPESKQSSKERLDGQEHVCHGGREDDQRVVVKPKTQNDEHQS